MALNQDSYSGCGLRWRTDMHSLCSQEFLAHEQLTPVHEKVPGLKHAPAYENPEAGAPISRLSWATVFHQLNYTIN